MTDTQDPDATIVTHADELRHGIDDPATFEADLAVRTKVPVERIADYSTWPESRFHEEIEEVNAALKRFTQAVVDAMESPDAADDFIRDMDLKMVSQDHGWRGIFSTLKSQQGWNTGHKSSALVKYLQYLGFRKRLAEFVYSRQGNLEETRAWAGMAKPPMRVEYAGVQYLRLPMGEATELALPDSSPVAIMLATHPFKLSAGEPPEIGETNGRRHPLKPGRNLVGRHPSADVVMDGDYSSVSRAHLLIEVHDSSHMTVIDVSSGGTFVPAACLSGKDRCLVDDS